MTKPRSDRERGFVAEQLEFADVVGMELIPGDPYYTAWLISRSSAQRTRKDLVAGEEECGTDPLALF